MEVKETNPNLAAILLNNKSMASSTAPAVAETGFANLLNESLDSLKSVFSAPTMGKVADQTPDAAIVDTKDAKPAVKEKDSRPVDRKDDRKKVAKPAKEKDVSRKDKTVSDATAPVAAQVTPEQPIAKTAPAAQIAGTQEIASVESAPAAATGSYNVVIIEQDGVSNGVMEAAFKAEGVIGILADGSISFADSSLTMEALAAMPMVKVLNADGEIITMTGAELVAKMQPAAGEQPLQQVPFIDAVKLTKIPSEIAEKAVQFFEASQTVAADAVTKPVVYEDAELAAQAQMLDEKLGNKNGLKIEVTTHEEKIAYNGTTDLIKDRVVLDKLVQEALVDTDAAPQNPLTANSAARNNVSAPLAQQQAAQAVQPQADFNAAAAAAMMAQNADVDQVAATAVRTAAATEINSVSAATSAASGSEFVNTARAEANNKLADTAAKDVYKGMSKEVVDQVKINITKSAIKGVDKIDISLKPEDLGQIEIKMQIAKDGKLHAHIVANRPETMEVLQKEAQNLEQAFKDAGFSTDADSLSFSYNDGNQAGANAERNSELRNFIGNVFAQETGDSAAGNDNSYYWDPAKGLNIRV